MIPERLVVTSGGRRLAGSLYLPEGPGPVPGVLFCHGFTGSRLESWFMFPRLARRLVQAGLAVLTFDFAGSGESEGEFEEMTVPGEVEDALAALSALAAQAAVDADRLGILGYSLGGCVAACVLGRRRELRAGVLWAPVAELAELVAREREVAKGAEPAVGSLLLGEGFFSTVSEVRPAEEIARSAAAVLVVHGGADETVPPEHGRRLAEACGGRYLAIDGAGHGFDTPEHCRRLFAASASWFEEHLGR